MTAWRLITPPAVEPVSLIEAKRHLRIDSVDDVTLYSITSASYVIGTVTGEKVDVLGHEALVVFDAGAVGGTLTVHLEESDDGIIWTEAATFAQVTSDNDEATFSLRYVGIKQYIRAVAVVSGVPAVFGVTIVKQGSVFSEDALISSLIVAAREYCETFTRRALVTQTWKLHLSEWPAKEILLPFGNLQSVASVKYKDSTGVQITWDPANYIVDTDSDLGRILCAYGVSWPSATYPVHPIEIQFICGYGDPEDVPQSIRNAMLLLIAHWYAHREAVAAGSTSREIDFAVSSLLAPYRLFGW